MKTYSDSKWVGRWGGREGISKENEEVFRGDGYISYFDCGDGFRGTDMLKLTKFYKFGM